ncbi:ARPP-2 domain-containing protein [Nocardiopsis valliformis]|uniref:ARPP-2 domain-containing protein n=1 Tax=Nocardiopsis valliformis TaxID=239974 RepID=UPI00034A4884|nr:hypothetical protein [Nocardiopsis valliformis]
MTPTQALSAEGLRTGPDQRWGNVRLVPLLRGRPVEGLRLHPLLSGITPERPPGDLTGSEDAQAPEPVAYLPHAYLTTWDEDALPAAAYGTHLLSPFEPPGPERISLAARRGQASRAERDRPRFLPWELNVEGHLALCFRAPQIAWEHLNRTRLRTDRMSAPAEAAYLGREVGDLARALEVFEIHPDQCGVALYVTDELVSVQLAPHPHDYRLLHPSLLLELFGETLYTRGLMTPAAPSLYQPLRAEGVRTLAELRQAVDESRAASARGHDELMLSSLTAQHSELSRRGAHGGFTLFGFRPAFTRDGDQHVGEAVTGPDGHTAYLSSFRLSPSQVRRGHLLRVLDENEWRIDLAARALGTGHADLLTRLERTGLAYLLNPDVLLQHRSARLRTVGRRTP